MTELKTLKDFDYKNDDYSLIVVKEFRQEAIKWVKDCCPEPQPESLGSEFNLCLVCRRTVALFDLTEDDLK